VSNSLNHVEAPVHPLQWGHDRGQQPVSVDCCRPGGVRGAQRCIQHQQRTSHCGSQSYRESNESRRPASIEERKDFAELLPLSFRDITCLEVGRRVFVTDVDVRRLRAGCGWCNDRFRIRFMEEWQYDTANEIQI
jgi:hypothetical protein